MNMVKPVLNDIMDRDEDQSSASVFTLAEFVQVVRARRTLILGCFVGALAAAAVALVLLTPLYSATATVMLQPQRNAIDGSSLLTPMASDQPSIQNQVQILTSVELANRVIDKLKLAQDPEFSSPGLWGAIQKIVTFSWFPGASGTLAAEEKQSIERSELVHSFLSHITAVPIGVSTAIDVSFQSSNADKAQRIANALANAYVDDQLEAKFDATARTSVWLTGRISDLSLKAQTADAAVQRYKAEHNITTNANGSSLVQQQTSDVNNQLIISKTQLAEKEAAYQSLKSLAQQGRASASSAAMSSPVISALRAQDTEITRQLADMSSRYLPGHPKILDLQAQKQNVDAKIDEEVQRTVDAAQNEVSVAAAHVGSLQSSLNGLEHQGATQNVASVELTGLQSAARAATAMYETFLAKQGQSQGQEGIETPDARIISMADLPSSPAFPKKGMVLVIAGFLGVVAGLILAFAAERLDSGFRTPSQIERLLHLPVLATVPQMRGVSPSADIIAHPLSSYAEAIRGVQLGLEAANIDRQPKIIMVTSSLPGEGKTTMAVSLARLAARNGKKTLLIDADLRHPNVAHTIESKPMEFGLVEVLSGRAPLEQCTFKDPLSDLYVLSCVTRPSAPSDLLASQSMKDLLHAAAQHFDLVIVDSAPVLPVNDTKILASLVHAVLFLVRWEETRRDAALSAVRALRDIHAPLSGVAMSRADAERFFYYNYGYQSYGKYKSYYGT